LSRFLPSLNLLRERVPVWKKEILHSSKLIFFSFFVRRREAAQRCAEGMVGGLGALLMVLAISICIPYSTQEAPKKKSHQAHPTDYNVTQSRQELLAFYQDMQSQGKVYSDNRTTSAPTELHPDPFVCMVSVMKDEELFVDEWIAYHHFIGIDYFFICDHGKTSLQTFLAPHIEAGYLTVMPWYKLPHIAGINDQCSCYELAFHLMNESKFPSNSVTVVCCKLLCPLCE